MPGDGFVTTGQWKECAAAYARPGTKVMSHDTDRIRPATAYAGAAPLDLLLTAIAVDPLLRCVMHCSRTAWRSITWR